MVGFRRFDSSLPAITNPKNLGIFNYEKWLVYIARYGYFNDYEFERRFCPVPPFKFVL